MKLKKYAYRCLAVVCAVVTVACVDDQYRLDEVSTEISVISEKTVLPVGSVERRTLGELIGEDRELPSYLRRNDDGSYEVKFDTTAIIKLGEQIDLEQLTKPVPIPATPISFPISLPKLNLGEYSFEFDESFPMNMKGAEYFPESGEEELKQEYLDMFGDNVPAITCHLDGLVEIDPIHLQLPDQINSIEQIHFADYETGHHGAPFHVVVDLNGLKGINDGGSLTFTLKPEDAELVLYDGKGNLVGTNDDGAYVIPEQIEEGQEEIDFAVYVESIINQSELNEDHSTDVNLSMSYDVSFKINPKAGMMVAETPVVGIKSHFELLDADVIFNAEEPLFTTSDSEMDSEGFSIEIPGIPEQLESINRIELIKDTKLTMYAEGLEWLEENGDAVSIEMTLPEELVLKKIDGMGYEYNEQEHLLTMSITDLCNDEGLQIGLEAIDFGGHKPENGMIAIEFNPSIEVSFSSDSSVSVMGFFPEYENIEVTVGLQELEIAIESVSAKINFSGEIDGGEPMETGLGELMESLEQEGSTLEIGGAGLSPVIELSLYNPLTISANIAASIVPMVNEERKEDAAIEFDAEIKAAIYDEVTGEIIPQETKVVLAKPNCRDDYADVDCVFVGCDIDELINIMPTHIAFDASYGLPNEVITLYMMDNLDLEYALNFNLPIAFDDKLHIAFEATMPLADEGEESPLASIASIEGIKVGDVAIIAKIASTIPLEFGVETLLLDANGEVLPTVAGFAEGSAILGSKDGVTEALSELRMQVDLAAEDGSLVELADIHSVLIRAEANSVGEGVVSLKDEQYIEASLKLEIDGGVTVDLSKLNE